MNIPLLTSSVKKPAYCEKKSVELLRSSYHQQDHLNVAVNRDVISYCWYSADNKIKTLAEVEIAIHLKKDYGETTLQRSTT